MKKKRTRESFRREGEIERDSEWRKTKQKKIEGLERD
jgi:hypothetical protein